MAAQKRALKAVPGAFHEPAIHYLGESVTIWSLRQYMANPKWRDDAVRRSKRNVELLIKESKRNLELNAHNGKERSKRKRSMEDKQISDTNTQRIKKPINKRERFKSIMEELYQKSLNADE